MSESIFQQIFQSICHENFFSRFSSQFSMIIMRKNKCYEIFIVHTFCHFPWANVMIPILGHFDQFSVKNKLDNVLPIGVKITLSAQKALF
jgi:hypothetical protein